MTSEQELHEELSAFMDGELDADRARFLQQRLSHDANLRERWERWQLMSSAIRRQAQPVPTDFADRVARAIDAEAAPGMILRSSKVGWGGVALAASIAAAAVFMFDGGHQSQPVTQQVAAVAAPLLIQRTVLQLPEPNVKLPIPVESGVVTAIRSPLRPILVRESAQHPNFSPFPQPYPIDPELAAYLRNQKSGRARDVFTESSVSNAAVRTVAWPQ